MVCVGVSLAESKTQLVRIEFSLEKDGRQICDHSRARPACVQNKLATLFMVFSQLATPTMEPEEWKLVSGEHQRVSRHSTVKFA